MRDDAAARVDAGLPVDAAAPVLGGIGASCQEDEDCQPGLECNSIGGGQRACELDD